MKVRDRGPRGLGWWARAWLSATVAWAVVALLAVLPISVGTVQQAHADSGALTEQGPPVWIPSGSTGATGGYGPDGSVTVTPTTNLTDQVVHVSWKGFTPSIQNGGAPATVVTPKSTSVYYAVRVYECRGADPQVTDCYGSTLYGADPSNGFLQKQPAVGTTTPDLPSNMAIATTAADGTGSANIETWTGDQSPSLGCDATHQCSIVVEPNYGGDSMGYTAFLKHDPPGTLHCEVHTYDRTPSIATSVDAVMVHTSYRAGYASGEGCAWANRTVVPLNFAPTAASCASGNTTFSMAGLPMAERAVQQWRAGACLGAAPIYAGYTSQGEPQARQSFLNGSGADVALTSDPDTAATAPRPYVYVPLANSAVSVVFLVDDPKTGQQITQMRLNPRLLAKELTQSYAQAPAGSQPASVTGNPRCIFEDPEFLALNPPSLIAPAQWPTCDDSNPDSLPVVAGNATDMIQQLTSWIAGDPDAAAFLQGAPDPWGMHVDPYYERPSYPGYPTNLLTPQDSTGIIRSDKKSTFQKRFEWNPVINGLDSSVRMLLQNTSSCQEWLADANGINEGCPALFPGQRVLIGIIDSGDAQSYSLPEAQLVNPAGSFVTPTIGTVQAAVNDMSLSAATNTQSLPYGVPDTAYSRDPNAYPLAMVQYAMLPTAGLAPVKATAVSTFFQQVTDPGGGQLYGRAPGQLGPGFVDLTQNQLGSAQDALQHVSVQDGTLPGNQQPPAPSPTPSPTGSPSPTAQAAALNSAAGGSAADDSSAANSGSGSGQSASGGTSGAGGTGGDTAANPPAPNATPAPSGSPAPSAAGSAVAAAPGLVPVAAGTPSPDRAGLARLLLPVVLIIGAVLLVGGPAALVFSGTAAGARLVTRLRRGPGGGAR